MVSPDYQIKLTISRVTDNLLIIELITSTFFTYWIEVYLRFLKQRIKTVKIRS